MFKTGDKRLHPAPQPNHIHRCAIVRLPTAVAVAQLTVEIVSPTLDPALNGHRTDLVPVLVEAVSATIEAAQDFNERPREQTRRYANG